MKSDKIVVIEDEEDILEVIAYNLKREGYEVTTSTSGEDGLAKIERAAPDLVILDLMLPEIDGLDLCRKLKSDPVTKAIPVIMVTAKGEESDVVLGLGMGADDYMVKPFSPKELVARVKAVLRRSRGAPETERKDRIVRDGIIIDPQRHDVRADGESIVLTATEFRLLLFLASHPGRVFTRDQLLTRVIGEEAIVIDRNIDVHVRAIRKKLGGHRHLIETIRGVGYRFKD
ncbi:MAG TPA: response regulator [Candidatus Krumholzibacteria bacterium]|nr:response regulator [Candidatus Krumholzibacteria bacterium]